ncbi:DNA primase [Gemella haemolysans]|uniref:DNA primase n=1 Tax=Gemella haemolysans ATCC 10379 TaxID=546270 RepID=C5NX66_9BACL|nr:DNA primase [Gemella haemolysans]EER68172.1 DNA primase [Gemella haemolysans ATCC 10379]KAA8706911.1 DNA primase [Gemella haemolysans]UBH81610.1 DNA primase [Gemella haemolysans]VEI38485.1 DNA primase [Gemella haemolysans]
MAKISKQDIDYIFDNIDIVSLVSEYVKLEKRGQNYLGLCPFHNEKTPSFTVSSEKKIAHCFGCGKGGNIFQFVSLIENITYNQAIVKLGTRLGLDIESNNNKEESYDLNNELDIMYYGHRLLADYYNYILLNTKEAEDALKYLLDRGLSEDVIKHFNLGYAPRDNNIALNFFNSNKINLDLMVEAGLLGKNDNGDYYDVFKDRVMFPIKNNQNQVVAFSGRTMSSDKNVPKYYNTHETKIFEKRTVLYNFSDARLFIAKENEVILCEGYMDVIKAHQNGMKNAVALMGTNIDNNKLKEVLSLVKKITLSLDNDEAGSKAQIEIGNRIIQTTDNVYKLKFSGAKDLDEFLTEKNTKNPDFDVENYLRNNKEHFINYKIEFCKNDSKSNIEQRIKYKNEILVNIAYVEDESLKYILLTNLAEEFGIERQVLLKELGKVNVKRKKAAVEWVVPTNPELLFRTTNYDKKMCKLFKYFFVDRSLFVEKYNDLEKCQFPQEAFVNLMDYLVIYYNNNLEFHIHKFIHSIDDDEVVRLATYIDETDFLIEENPTADVVGDYIIYFSNKEMTLKEIKDRLRVAIQEMDTETQKELLLKLKKYKK